MKFSDFKQPDGLFTVFAGEVDNANIFIHIYIYTIPIPIYICLYMHNTCICTYIGESVPWVSFWFLFFSVNGITCCKVSDVAHVTEVYFLFKHCFICIWLLMTFKWEKVKRPKVQRMVVCWVTPCCTLEQNLREV
jgi:hypothetical protein